MRIPKGWALKEIGHVAEVVTGNTPSRKIPQYFGGRIPWIKPPDINRARNIFDSEEYLTEDGAKQARILPKDAIMVTCIGNIGNVAIAGTEVATNQQINSIVIKDQNILPKYVYYQALTWKEWLYENSTATTISMINKSRFSKAPLLLAPLPEQKRIVAKLDTLFAHLDQLRSRLDKIPVLLKQFRQAVLTQAVTAKLIQSFSRNIRNPIVIGEPSEAAPTHWHWKKLIDVATLESGHTPRKSVAAYWENGDVPWISLQDIREAHGKVIVKTKHYTTAEGIANSSARILPKGTVCFSRDISVGYVTIMGTEMATTQHFANWICGKELNNYYLMYCFMAARLSLIESGKGTTVDTIYMPALKEMFVLMPSVVMQEEIVNELRRVLSIADTIEGAHKLLLRKINELPIKILAKALRGELVKDQIGKELKTYGQSIGELMMAAEPKNGL